MPDNASGSRSRYEMWWCLGGMISLFDGRGPGMKFLGIRTPHEGYSGVLPSLKRPHLEYFKDIYADTALFGGQVGRQCGFDFFGYDQVVFATDFPFAQISHTLDAVNAASISRDARERIMHGNALRLLSLARSSERNLLLDTTQIEVEEECSLYRQRVMQYSLYT